MTFIKPGQRVTVYQDDADPLVNVRGIITSATIYADRSVSYTVRWWSDGEPVDGSFAECELDGVEELARVRVHGD